MIGKVLVANRGEIALRVIRACRELGVRSVAVYSTADRDSLHHELADESVCIGPPPAASSYLNVPAIISAAELTGADAVHPGYGFLAENARFAEICERVGLTFVGPSSRTIARMGDKAEAREAAAEAGVPITPGSDGPCESVQEVKRVGAEVGYPLVIKASAGGGGKGMRVVEIEAEVEDAYLGASREAGATFGDGSVYVEKYLERLRHVEVQMLADSHGSTVTFPERDCSIQRRYQKLIEESPAPGLPEDVREGLMDASERLVGVARVRGGGYRGVRLRGRGVLLHRDEHASSGRAPGDGDDLGRRHRGRAVEGCLGRAARDPPRRPLPGRPRDRVQDQRRGPRP